MTTKSLACCLLLAAPASAATIENVVNGGASFDYAPSPQSVTWRVATADDHFVEWVLTGLVASPIGFQNATIATIENTKGVDWPAWSAAILDPDYTRSIITFAGVTKETLLHRPAVPFTMDRLQIFIDDWADNQVFRHDTLSITGFAVHNQPVPEPATLVLVAIIALVALVAAFSIAARSKDAR